MPSPSKRRRRARVIRSWLVQVGAYLLLWFVLTGTLSKAEFIAGFIASAIAATACEVVWSQPLARFTADPALLGQAWRMPKYAIQGTLEVLGVLFHHVRGRPAPSVLRAVKFDAGHEQDAWDGSRRALAVAYTSATPNFVVVGIDQERNLLLFHQLKPGEVLRMTQKLGAQ